MPLSTINGRDGTADFTIGAQSYKTVLNEFEVESNVEMIDSSVFSIEGVPTQDPGMERLFFRLSGIGKQGAPESGPWIPAPQGVAVVFTFSSAKSPTCTISFTANFTRALVRRTVNRNAIIAGEGTSNGAFTVAWNRST